MARPIHDGFDDLTVFTNRGRFVGLGDGVFEDAAAARDEIERARG